MTTTNDDEREGPRVTPRQVALYLAILAVPAAISTLLVWRYLPDWWPLSFYFWYSIPGNSFMLLPHEPAVVAAGTLYHPGLVAIVGGLATIPASAFDYQLFRRAFQLGFMTQAKESRISLTAQRMFNVQPWWTTVFFAFSPIPFYPIRLVAPLAGYPATRYVAAVFVGRVPRYYLLAWFGEQASRWLSLELLWDLMAWLGDQAVRWLSWSPIT